MSTLAETIPDLRSKAVSVGNQIRTYTCPCRKSNSGILVMQPAQDRTAKSDRRLALPKITSGPIDSVGRPRPEWQRCRQTAQRPNAVAHFCPVSSPRDGAAGRRTHRGSGAGLAVVARADAVGGRRPLAGEQGVGRTCHRILGSGSRIQWQCD